MYSGIPNKSFYVCDSVMRTYLACDLQLDKKTEAITFIQKEIVKKIKCIKRSNIFTQKPNIFWL